MYMVITFITCSVFRNPTTKVFSSPNLLHWIVKEQILLDAFQSQISYHFSKALSCDPVGIFGPCFLFVPCKLDPPDLKILLWGTTLQRLNAKTNVFLFFFFFCAYRRALTTSNPEDAQSRPRPLGTSPALIKSVQHDLLVRVRGSVFDDLSEHFLDQDLTEEDDHGTQLVKKISGLFIKTVLHHHGRLYTERFVNKNKSSKRHQLTKTILFLGQ